MDDHSDQLVADERAGGSAAAGSAAGSGAAEGSVDVAIAERERAVVALWGELSRAADLVRSRLARCLEAGPGLAPEEVELLMVLAAAPEGRLRMIDVSESLRLSKSGVTRLVDRLAERGLVLRAACPSDRRVVYAGLTDQGTSVLDSAAPLFVSGLMEQLGGRLAADQMERLRHDLSAIAGPTVEAAP
jgi:DNA-binding MarR family transcriptional regulator